jgi:glycine cleavage system pyridoxal-binding protein P
MRHWIIADDGCTWLNGAVAVDLTADPMAAALVAAPAHLEAETVIEAYQAGRLTELGGTVVTFFGQPKD